MSQFDDPEASYRRGYTQGAQDVITAVRDLLPAAELKKLEAWHSGPASKWRLANATGKSKRGAEGFVGADLAPPRRLLKLGRKSN